MRALATDFSKQRANIASGHGAAPIRQALAATGKFAPMAELPGLPGRPWGKPKGRLCRVPAISLIDPASLAIVAGGTVLTTLLHCGPSACRHALRVVLETLRPGFDPARARSELARQIAEIARNGLVRSEPRPIGDAEFDEATDALIASRSLQQLVERHREHRRRRLARAGEARLVLERAAELAPVLGLAGTLISLGLLAGRSPTSDPDLASTLGMAVLTTFYGLVTAHFIAAPLAEIVERRAQAEDARREELFAWLEDEVARAEPGLRMRGKAAA